MENIMEDTELQLGPQQDCMDKLTVSVPFLGHLLKRIKEYKRDIIACRTELRLISNKLREGKMHFPEGKLACDCKLFCQSPDNEVKTYLLQNSTSYNEDGGTAERTTSEKDTGQRQAINLDIKDNFEETIEGREKICCKICEDTNPQQECYEEGTHDREMPTAFVQGGIQRHNVLEESKHNEYGTTSGGYVDDAEVLPRNLNSSNDDIDKITETEQYDGNKSPPRNAEEISQHGNVSCTYINTVDSESVYQKSIFSSNKAEMDNDNNSENDSIERRFPYDNDNATQADYSMDQGKVSISDTLSLHTDLKTSDKTGHQKDMQIGERCCSCNNINVTPADDSMDQGKVSAIETFPLHQNVNTADKKHKKDMQKHERYTSYDNGNTTPDDTMDQRKVSTSDIIILHKDLKASDETGHQKDMQTGDRCTPCDNDNVSTDHGKLLANDTFSLSKDQKTSDKTGHQNCRHRDESCSPSVSLLSEQEKHCSGTQCETHRCNMSISKSFNKERNHETKNNGHSVISGKRTCSGKEQVENNGNILNKTCDFDAIREKAKRNSNKIFEQSKDAINISYENASTNVAVDMNTSRHNHEEAKPSNFDEIEMKSHICQKGGDCNTCKPTCDSAISAKEAMISTTGDEHNDTDSIHTSPFERQFDLERKHQRYELHTCFAEGLTSFQAISWANNDVITETPTTFYGNGDYRLTKTQSMDSVLSTIDSSLPTDDETRIPVIIPARLFSASLPTAPISHSKQSSIDDQITDLTSAFNGMEMRLKRASKMESKKDEETRQKRSCLMVNQSHLDSAIPDKSVAFRTAIDCCRPIRADSCFKIVLKTFFNHGDSLHSGGQGTFVVPFHGLYWLRLQADTKTINSHGQELSIGIELNQHQTASQFWLCLQTITSDTTPKSMNKTVVLKPGDLLYVKVEHVKGYSHGLQSVFFEGHSLYRIVK